MRIAIVTVFPEMFEAISGYGVTGRAVASGLVELRTFDPRAYAHDRHRRVDDRPYGGGPGMVMMVEPLRAAIDAARTSLANPLPAAAGPVVLLSPQGRRFDQAKARSLAAGAALTLVCGRYEGIDERLIELAVDEELSLGDFVLSGGEIGAMAVVDAVARLVPGVLGHADSAVEDSFTDGLLDCPHYTRPERIAGLQVPEVLLSGHHANVARWRLKQALGRTLERRPELLAARGVSAMEQALLDEFQRERDGQGAGVERQDSSPSSPRSNESTRGEDRS